METETEDELINKQIKTDNVEHDLNSDNSAPMETSISDDDSFLQEFLGKKEKTNLSMFQRVIKQEEIDAKERDPGDDLKLYRDACADFSDCVTDIAEIKATKSEGWKDQVSEIKKDAAFVSLVMKKLNRVEKTRTKISREKISQERQKVNVARVKLDNMLSEMQHLRKEIDKCLKFRSRPLGIDLVPVNEFYENAPSSISKPEITKNDEHQLQLARLEWELKQRKELASLLNDLENKRSVISEQIDKKEKDLNSLAPLIKEVLSVTQPLKEKLGPSPSKVTTISDRAALLPDPLYFLYVQASAYRDACDKHLSIEIKGDFAEARRFKNKSNDDSLMEVCEVMDDSEETVDTKKNMEQEQNKLLSKHPLYIHLKLFVKDGCSLELQIFYLKNLHILTVVPSFSESTVLKGSLSDVLMNCKTVLHNLFAGDSGHESPNLMNYYQLKKVGLENFDTSKLGFPYVWAQKLGGLNFGGVNKIIEPKQDVARMSLPVIMKELKRRCLYRFSLLSLFRDFEQGNIISPKNMKSIKLECKLKSIKGISWNEYCEHPLSENFKNSSYVSENDMHFKAVVTREEAQLTCLIAVKHDYPLTPSVFAVGMDYESCEKEINKLYCLDIEKEVNLYWKEMLSSRTEATLLLSFQLFRVMVCFDIVLESLIPQSFKSNKRFTEELFRGSNRALPFKYDSEENIFTHRD